ncbi:hypothetical protein [Nocardioides pakistanensis]
MASEHTCARDECRHPFKDHYGQTCVLCSCHGFVETLTGHACDTGRFDRSVCPEPCGAMHSFCTLCGARQGPCPLQGSAPVDRIPTRDEVDLARRALAGFGTLRGPLVEHGPDSVRDSFAFLEQVVRTADHVAATQPEELAEYRDDLNAVAEQAINGYLEITSGGAQDLGRAVVDALLESVTLARMLAGQRSGEPSSRVRTPGQS